mgnify:CR=1 FL=1
MADVSLIPGYCIRPAREADVEQACEIAKQAWQRIHDSFRQIMGADMHDGLCANWEARKADQVRAHWRQFPEQFYVVESEASGRVVAFLTFRMDLQKSLGTIGNNAVASEGQGQGIGTAMYQFLLDRFRESGLRFATVSTGLDEGHAPARRAYEKAGFDIRQENVTYYQTL